MIRPLEGGNGKKETKVIKKSYEHRRMLNQLLKTIWDVKMDEELKMVLTLRCWGVHPNTFKPMSPEQVAKQLKTSVKNVKKWEENALFNVKLHLKKYSMTDIVGRFNETEGGARKIFK